MSKNFTQVWREENGSLTLEWEGAEYHGFSNADHIREFGRRTLGVEISNIQIDVRKK